MQKIRLDKYLVQTNFAKSREQAQEMIKSGRVKVNGLIANKGAMQIEHGVTISLLADEGPSYVSRGAHKIIAGLDHFKVNVDSKVCIDIGASTGGFTDVLLKRGAKKVFAVDVGYGQLAWSIRTDDRVVVFERTNIRHLKPNDLDEPPELAVVDVSFISLKKVMEPIFSLLSDSGEKVIVALFKPQFEVGRERVGKGGVVREDSFRTEALDDFRRWAEEQSYETTEPVRSPLKGPAGNVEFLIKIYSKG